MKHLIVFPTDDGQAIVVEIDEAARPGAVRAGRTDTVAETAARTFETALGPVRSTVEALVAKLGTLSQQPDEVVVEFGFKLSAEAGAIIASTSGEASFKVTLKWAPST